MIVFEFVVGGCVVYDLCFKSLLASKAINAMHACPTLNKYSNKVNLLNLSFKDHENIFITGISLEQMAILGDVL